MAAHMTDIAYNSTYATLNSQYCSYGGHGCGGCGTFGHEQTYQCTYCKMSKHTTTTYGNGNWAQSGNGSPCGNHSTVGDTAGECDEKENYHCAIPADITPDCAPSKQMNETYNIVLNVTASVTTAGDCVLL
jgi:hypothetical protein